MNSLNRHVAHCLLIAGFGLGLVGCGGTSPIDEMDSELMTLARNEVKERRGVEDSVETRVLAAHHDAPGEFVTDTYLEVVLFLVDYQDVSTVPIRALAIAARDDSIGAFGLGFSTAFGDAWLELDSPPVQDDVELFIDLRWRTGQITILRAFRDAAAWEEIFGEAPPFNYAPGTPPLD